MDCYVINLDRCTERWEKIEAGFSGIDVCLIRVSAIDVARETKFRRVPFYRPFWFRFFTGRPATAGEIGCYYSHLKALRMFLDSGAERALICEDDVIPERDLMEILEETEKYAEYWNLLRLAKCRKRGFQVLTQLASGQELGINVKGFAYAAAYMIDRKGAEFMLKHARAMTLPWDLVLNRGWNGMTEMSLVPGAFRLGEEAENTTIVGRKRRGISSVLFIWSGIVYKVYLRLRRYRIQYRRIQLVVSVFLRCPGE